MIVFLIGRDPWASAVSDIRNLQGGRSEINVQTSSSGAAGLLAIRVPSMAPNEILKSVMESAHDIAVEGIERTLVCCWVRSWSCWWVAAVYVPKNLKQTVILRV